tara:strand:+ start:624 stop:830 length:207 start_codon:yes stop_codon:yes gene_type:complete
MPKINLLNTSNRSNSNYSNTIKYDESIKSINTKFDNLVTNFNGLIKLMSDANDLADISDTSLNMLTIN